MLLWRRWKVNGAHFGWALPSPTDAHSHPPRFPKGEHRCKESEGVFKLNASQKVKWAGTQAFAGNTKLVKHLRLILPDKSIHLATKQNRTRPGELSCWRAPGGFSFLVLTTLTYLFTLCFQGYSYGSLSPCCLRLKIKRHLFCSQIHSLGWAHPQ